MMMLSLEALAKFGAALDVFRQRLRQFVIGVIEGRFGLQSVALKRQRVRLRRISFQEITLFHKCLFCREHDYSLDLIWKCANLRKVAGAFCSSPWSLAVFPGFAITKILNITAKWEIPARASR